MNVKRSLAKYTGPVAIATGAAYLGSRYLPTRWRRRLAKTVNKLPQKLSPSIQKALPALLSPELWSMLRNRGLKATGRSLLSYAGQAALERAWLPLMLGRQRADGRVPSTLKTLGSVAAASYLLYRRSRIAHGLMLPGATWMLLFSLVSGAIWRMNKQHAPDWH